MSSESASHENDGLPWWEQYLRKTGGYEEGPADTWSAGFIAWLRDRASHRYTTDQPVRLPARSALDESARYWAENPDLLVEIEAETTVRVRDVFGKAREIQAQSGWAPNIGDKEPMKGRPCELCGEWFLPKNYDHSLQLCGETCQRRWAALSRWRKKNVDAGRGNGEPAADN